MKTNRVIGVIGSATDVALFSEAVGKIPGFKALSLTQSQEEEVPKTVRIQPSPDGDDEGEFVQGPGRFLSQRHFTMVSPVKGMHTGEIQEQTTPSKAGLGTQSPFSQSDPVSVAPKHLNLPD